MSDTALATYAGELKAWRERMELTQQAFADKLGYSAALVAAVEQCKRSPTADFAIRCDDLTGAPGTFVRWQIQVARESYPAFFAPVIAFERDAIRIHGWELGAVPKSRVLVRDTNDRTGPTLRFTSDSWCRFAHHMKGARSLVSDS
jgi:transcriptional regulator with XRE-family HTH domain